MTLYPFFISIIFISVIYLNFFWCIRLSDLSRYSDIVEIYCFFDFPFFSFTQKKGADIMRIMLTHLQYNSNTRPTLSVHGQGRIRAC
jgi:hypothetical protein